jgi:lipoprotein-releasing system permease protein
MLGVATMIVVNSVMEGFSTEMQDRIHGILSDVVFGCRSLDGMPYNEELWQRIHEAAGDDIEALSPTVIVDAMVNYRWEGQWITHQVKLIGIDEKTQSTVSDIGKYLQHPKNREAMSFALRESGYDTRDHQSGSSAPERRQMEAAGWWHRRQTAQLEAFPREFLKTQEHEAPTAPMPSDNPFAGLPAAENVFDPAKQQNTGVVLGLAMASFRTPAGEDYFCVIPGDDVQIAFYTGGQPPKIGADNFTVVDFYESKMAEYDSTFAFVPIRKLQELRGMIDPTTGEGRVNVITIKLKPGIDGQTVCQKLQAAFPGGLYKIETWRDRQGPLLAAVDMEKRILNLLLFLIIAVAGFGILAIFYMIVVEKTRDIGILKSLGAPGRGVMGIFLGYGLLLGMVGSGMGLAAGLLFVRYINEIAAGLTWITGRPVFDPSIYYFYKIPAIVVPQTIVWIVGGALAIAVLASILPARRAARLHPVEALAL